MSATASGKLVVAALPMPQGLSQTTARIREGAAEYWQLFRSRNSIRATFFLMLLLITVVVFFSSVWLALFLSKQITRPVEALADAMDEIAAGKYDHRVGLVTTGEMGDLVRSFNHMAADLETSRQLAESSSAQLTAANQAIEERRRELETIVETIPSRRGHAGWIGVGAAGQSRLCRADGLGRRCDSARREARSAAAGRVRRRSGRRDPPRAAHGRGLHRDRIPRARPHHASGHHQRAARAGALAKPARCWWLKTPRSCCARSGSWRGKKWRSAWPTRSRIRSRRLRFPPSASARHLDRGQPDSPNIIRKCSEVILGCVGTLRTLVDQFSALAQFPAPQPRACDMNQVAEEALALFRRPA